VIDKFYGKYLELLTKHNFSTWDIYNTDETNEPTVLDSTKVLALTGSRQVYIG